MEDPVYGYDADADNLAQRYEALSTAQVHAAVLEFLPPGGSALDIGAGSGRDAAWLSSRGFDVVAAEPSRELRSGAARRHSEAGILWVDDRLPELSSVYALDQRFDLILMSGVWMHVHPSDRTRGFSRLSGLMASAGVLMMSFRNGLGGPGRPMWNVELLELRNLARANGLAELCVARTPDLLGRADVDWTALAFTVA